MKKYGAAIIVALVLAFSALVKHNETAMKAEDSYIMDRVVMLKGDQGLCSGIEITSDSGKHYVLSAAHCTDIMKNNKAEAIRENGSKFIAFVIKVDRLHDLLLMSSADNTGIQIDDHVYKHQHIRTLTHGQGMPTYRSDGEVLAEQEIHVAAFMITSPADEVKCRAEKNRKVVQIFIFPPFCEATMNEVSMTAKVVPGSSGGAVLNDAGRLVGIVSSTNGDFGFMVPLKEIKAFLKGL